MCNSSDRKLTMYTNRLGSSHHIHCAKRFTRPRSHNPFESADDARLMRTHLYKKVTRFYRFIHTTHTHQINSVRHTTPAEPTASTTRTKKNIIYFSTMLSIQNCPPFNKIQHFTWDRRVASSLRGNLWKTIIKCLKCDLRNNCVYACDTTRACPPVLKRQDRSARFTACFAPKKRQ